MTSSHIDSKAEQAADKPIYSIMFARFLDVSALASWMYWFGVLDVSIGVLDVSIGVLDVSIGGGCIDLRRWVSSPPFSFQIKTLCIHHADPIQRQPAKPLQQLATELSILASIATTKQHGMLLLEWISSADTEAICRSLEPQHGVDTEAICRSRALIRKRFADRWSPNTGWIRKRFADRWSPNTGWIR